jgi:hypothetical protein
MAFYERSLIQAALTIPRHVLVKMFLQTSSHPVGDTTFHGAAEFGQEWQIAARSGDSTLHRFTA